MVDSVGRPGRPNRLATCSQESRQGSGHVLMSIEGAMVDKPCSCHQGAVFKGAASRPDVTCRKVIHKKGTSILYIDTHTTICFESQKSVSL